MPNISRYLKIIPIFIFTMIILAGCNSGNTLNEGPSISTNIQNNLKNSDNVSIEPLGTIPLVGSLNNFLVRITNPSDKNYQLDKVEVIDPVTSQVTNKLARIQSQSCQEVAAHSYCTIGITPLLTKSGSMILKAYFSSGIEKVSANQIIRVSDKVAAHNGIYFNNDISTLKAHQDGSYGMSIPVVLEKSFSDIHVTNGVINCNSKSAGGACTYVLDGKLSDTTLIAASLKATPKEDGKEVNIKTDTLVYNDDNQYAYILASQPTDLDPGTSAQVVLFNTGTAPAKNLQITVLPETFTFRHLDGNCENQLAAGNYCVIEVSAKSGTENSSVAMLQFKYDFESNKPKNFIVNFLYLANDLDLALELVPSNSNQFINSLIGIEKNNLYRLKNIGAKKLSNLRFQLDNQNMKIVDNKCLDKDLPASGSCEFRIIYKATEVVSQSVAFISVTGNYSINNVSKTFYFNYGINYSGINPNNALSFTPGLLTLFSIINQEITQIVTVKNITNYTAQIELPSLDQNPDSALSLDYSGLENPCNSQILNGNLECQIKVKFSPKKFYNSVDSWLNIPIIRLQGITQNLVPAKLKLKLFSSATAEAAPNINVVTSVNSGNQQISALNDNVNVLLTNQDITVDYAFTNNGGIKQVAPAFAFNVNTASLANRFIINSKDSLDKSIKVGETHKLQLKFINPKKDGSSSSLSDGVYPLDLEYSYFDPISNKRIIKKTDRISLNIASEWVEGLVLNPIVKATSEGYQVDLDAKFDKLAAVSELSNKQQKIILEASLSGIAKKGNACQVDAGTPKECENILTLPSLMPESTYFLDITIKHPDIQGSDFTKVIALNLQHAPDSKTIDVEGNIGGEISQNIILVGSVIQTTFKLRDGRPGTRYLVTADVPDVFSTSGSCEVAFEQPCTIYTNYIGPELNKVESFKITYHTDSGLTLSANTFEFLLDKPKSDQSVIISSNRPDFSPLTGYEQDCVLDPVTNLMWTKNPMLVKNAAKQTQSGMTSKQAFELVKSINQLPNGYCGHKDWRLPNINELRTLLQWTLKNGMSQSQWLNQAGFEGFDDLNLLSSTFFSVRPSLGTLCARLTDRRFGIPSGTLPTGVYNGYRCNNRSSGAILVRDTEKSKQNPLVIATGQTSDFGEEYSDGATSNTTGIQWSTQDRFLSYNYTGKPGKCSLDRVTGLVWLKDTQVLGTINGIKLSDPLNVHKVLSDPNIIKEINDQEYCGKHNWRIPNINELATLLNYGQANTGSWLKESGIFDYIDEKSGEFNFYFSSTLAYDNEYFDINFGVSGYIGILRPDKTAQKILFVSNLSEN